MINLLCLMNLSKKCKFLRKAHMPKAPEIAGYAYNCTLSIQLNDKQSIKSLKSTTVKHLIYNLKISCPPKNKNLSLFFI